MITKRGQIFGCRKCRSFEEWCLKNNKDGWLKLWDYELNKENPDEVSEHASKKIWFLCPKEIHKSELKRISNLTDERQNLFCIACGSFGQYLINEFGEDGILKYWDFKKNKNIDPFTIVKKSYKKVYLKCQNKDYHGSYPIRLDSFYRGSRCSYCQHTKLLHQNDSFGTFHEKNIGLDFIEKYWSDKNQKTAYEFSPWTSNKVYLKCQNDNNHEDYFTSCGIFTNGHRCPLCNESKGESRIRSFLTQNKIDFICQKEFEGLFGVNGGFLKYDFYLPMENILIEYQGEQHEKPVDFKGQGDEVAFENFKVQKEHDAIKKKYAKEKSLSLLEIWYYDYDKIENILEAYIAINKN